MNRFDPGAVAAAIASGTFWMPRDADLPDYGPNGQVQAAIASVNAYIDGWLAGAGASLRDHLGRAVRWADEAVEAGLDYGDDPLIFAVQLHRARAVGHWLLDGKIDRSLWSATADKAEALWRRERQSRPLLSPLSDVLVDRALAGTTDPTPPGTAVSDSGDGTASALAVAFAQTDARDRLTLIGHLLWRELEGWMGYLPNSELVARLMIALAAPDTSRCTPDQVWRLAYVLLPHITTPPALAVPEPQEGVFRWLPPNLDDFGWAETLFPALGLDRDPDATPQPGRPRFASWTRHPTFDLEVDWNDDPGGGAWFEMRGPAAGRLATALAAIGGKVPTDPAEALAELLTVPPTRHFAGNAAVRWDVLTKVLASPAPDPVAATALVAAGLADTDWRVRMAAVWGVGRLRIAALADRARAAALPALDDPGINGDDRHTLLALRDAAALRATGAMPETPTNDGAGPGGARRAAFVARIGALLDLLPLPPADRSAALIAALARLPISRGSLPRAWGRWLE